MHQAAREAVDRENLLGIRELKAHAMNSDVTHASHAPLDCFYSNINKSVNNNKIVMKSRT